MLLDDILKMHDRKEAFMYLSRFYLNASERERADIRDRWDFSVAWGFPVQSRLACRTGETYSCEDRIIASLVYYSIEDMKQEDRDIVIGLCVIYHSCILAGLDPTKLFGRVADVSSQKTATALYEFLNRNPRDRSMEAFFLKPHKNSDGEWEVRIGEWPTKSG
jgi:hypothetical protein